MTIRNAFDHTTGQLGACGDAQIYNEMLIVRGDNDPLTTIDSMARLRGITKSANILNIPFAGHVAFDDAPNVFLRTMGRFLGVSLETS